MPEGIMILGPSGAGKTTLGRLVAEKLGFSFVDVDDYIWRKDTEKPFSVMYPREEKISRLMGAIESTAHFVMAGSMYSVREHFNPFFELAVFLHADAQLRAERVHKRALAWFGSRILAGGDMHEAHQAYLEEIRGYDRGIGGMTLQQHESWLRSLRCKTIRLDGGRPLEENVKAVAAAYQKNELI